MGWGGDIRRRVSVEPSPSWRVNDTLINTGRAGSINVCTYRKHLVYIPVHVLWVLPRSVAGGGGENKKNPVKNINRAYRRITRRGICLLFVGVFIYGRSRRKLPGFRNPEIAFNDKTVGTKLAIKRMREKISLTCLTAVVLVMRHYWRSCQARLGSNSEEWQRTLDTKNKWSSDNTQPLTNEPSVIVTNFYL